MSIFSSIVSGIFSNRANDKAARAQINAAERGESAFREAVPQAIDATRRANETATAAQVDAFGNVINLFEDQRARTGAALNPFVQGELQQLGLRNQILGFDTPVQSAFTPANTNAPTTRGTGRDLTLPGSGGDQYQAYFDQNPDLAGAYGRIDQDNPNGFWQARGADFNGDGNISESEFGRAHYENSGRDAGRQLPNAFTAPAPQVAAAPQPTPRERFENGFFGDAFRADYERDLDNIDSALANQGLLFSGARMDAASNAFQDNYSRHQDRFLGFSMAAPNSAATNASVAYDQGITGNVANAFTGIGGAQAQGALNIGNAEAQGAYNLANAIAGFAGAEGDARANRAIGFGNIVNGGIQNITDTATAALGGFGGFTGGFGGAGLSVPTAAPAKNNAKKYAYKGGF